MNSRVMLGILLGLFCLPISAHAAAKKVLLQIKVDQENNKCGLDIADLKMKAANRMMKNNFKLVNETGQSDLVLTFEVNILPIEIEGKSDVGFAVNVFMIFNQYIVYDRKRTEITLYRKNGLMTVRSQECSNSVNDTVARYVDSVIKGYQ